MTHLNDSIKQLNTLLAILSLVLVMPAFVQADEIDTNKPLNKQGMTSYMDCPCPQLIAHRGASGNYPDSSLLAFEKALAFNSDILELDVHLSADNHVIVTHDDTLLRITGEDLVVANTSLDRIKQANAAATFRDENGHFPFREKNLKVLTLQDFIQAFPTARFNIELKPDNVTLAEKVHQFIESHQLHERVVVASKHRTALEHYRQLQGKSALTSAHVRDVIHAYVSWLFNLDISDASYQLLQLPYALVNQSLVQYFQEQGKLVHVWTVNDEQDIRRMLEIGVDGVMTDYPERAYPIFQELGLR